MRHDAPVRNLAHLPKAHLHLHLTGSMRPSTAVELAARQGRTLPAGLLDPASVDLDVTVRRGWSKFQRLYDAARDLLVGEAEVRRVLSETVAHEAVLGTRWLELQVDPTTYGPRLGGLQATVELVLDALSVAGAEHGVGTAVVIAASRARHPAEAETLARLAGRFVGRGVVGFGLSNDETRGFAEDWTKAFRLAREAGLVAAPHAGELRGPRSVRAAVDALGAGRLGHGVRAVEDPALLEVLAARGIVCEVCPASNVALGVTRSLAEVPVVVLREAGVPVALGADDPLVFRSDLLDQYVALRGQGLSDAALADLAACSIKGSCAPALVQAELLAEVAGWLASPAARPTLGRGRPPG